MAACHKCELLHSKNLSNGSRYPFFLAYIILYRSEIRGSVHIFFKVLVKNRIACNLDFNQNQPEIFVFFDSEYNFIIKALNI
jgi:hypothetical protein